VRQHQHALAGGFSILGFGGHTLDIQISRLDGIVSVRRLDRFSGTRWHVSGDGQIGRAHV